VATRALAGLSLAGLPLKTALRLLVAVLLFAALALMARKALHLREALTAVTGVDRAYLIPMVTIALLYYVAKALRWHYVLRQAGIAVPVGRTLGAYLAGQWFTFTPAGELVRAYFLGAGTDFARVAPTVVVQAVLDFGSLALVATVIAGLYPALAPAVLPVTVPLLLTAGLLACPPLRRCAASWRIVRWLTARHRPPVLDGVLRLARPRPLALGLLMGLPIVLAGAGMLFLSGRAVGLGRGSAVRAGGVYAVMQLLGGLSPLPQGLGVTEGAGTLLLSYLGVGATEAFAAIVVFRVATLGVSALLGALAALLLRLGAAAPAPARAAAGGALRAGPEAP
jgi:glycosyltransferase 2 family protein